MLPLCQIGGMPFLLMAIKAGVTFLIMRSFDPDKMLSAIGDSALGITNTGGMPAKWGPMSAEPGVDNFD